jgi:stage II sporulation protein D
MIRIQPCLLLIIMAVPFLALLQAAEASPPQQIRVVLDDTTKVAKIKGELDWSTASEKLAGSSQPGEVRVSGGKLALSLDGKSYTSARFISRARTGYVQFDGRGYRGHIELFVGQNGNVVVLNVLPLEEYLYGVVPAEMSPSWPEEALKCQAVAARTYALSRILANMERSYDVYGNVSDQAYKGLSGEHETTNRMVDATAGQIVEYQGEVITAFYSSCAGGMTKQGSAPYLRCVSSDNPESPHHNWEVQLSLEDLSRVVKDMGADIGPIKDVTVEYDALSGHLLSLIVHGANDSKQILGTTLRKVLGRSTMKSTRCRLYPAGSEQSPQIAISPARQTPHGAAPDAANVATEISLERVSYEDGSGGLATQESFGWLKTWVASALEQRTMKMRNMYAYDGKSLMQCNREMHMLSAAGAPAGNEAAMLPQKTPAVADAPLPDVEVVSARLSRSELSGGFVLRGDGYGHGIGMSQWGARGLAEEGEDYQSILHYFYYGVEIVNWDQTLLQPGDAGTRRQTADMEETGEFYESFTPVEIN